MNINELCVGMVVIHEGKPREIKYIIADVESVGVHVNGVMHITKTQPLRGIPLNEELFLKIGFTHCYVQSETEGFYKNEIIIKQDKLTGICSLQNIDCHSKFPILYLHELQLIYTALKLNTLTVNVNEISL